MTKVKDFPEALKNKKELQTFLGIINYVTSHYLPNVAILKLPLQKKLRKNQDWSWTIEDSNIIRKIKDACNNIPVMTLPKTGDRLIVTTDASDQVWAAALQFYQRLDDGTFSDQLRVARYANGVWNDSSWFS